MNKVLILTAGFGDGHNSAARNIRDALELISDNVKVEVLDLLESTYGSVYSAVRQRRLKVVQYTPALWGGIYSLLDRSSVVGRNLGGFSKLQNHLDQILRETQPDCVVSTYPLYGHVIAQLFRDHHERPFRFITVITDSVSVNSAWFRAPSDLFCVSNEATAEVLCAAGIHHERVRPLGFPVSPLFAELGANPIPAPGYGEPRKVLYIINCGKKRAGKAIDCLLNLKDIHLTVTVGRDAELKARLIERTRKAADRVHIIGWTNQMPQLMLSHHLVIGKAGGATVQEAIAGCCPMIVNQVIPGQEEGNARLIQQLRIGAVAEKKREVAEAVELAFAWKARRWRQWRENLSKISRPDASLRIAELIVAECDHPEPAKKIALFEFSSRPIMVKSSPSHSESKMLLCDFHIHTNYSDGKLTAPEVVDFYGQLGFDCICITDHLADPRRLIGKMSELCNFTLGQNQLDDYFAVLALERKRAWRKYGMILLTGIEFNKDGYTKKSSAHLLGVDLKMPIDPSDDLPSIISGVHAQGGLAIASHPHVMESEWGKNTLYLWENQERFAPLLDAWEIATRNNIFNRVGLKKLPFVANSDFHKPKHIYSWKTLLLCEKDSEAIKQCVRDNRNVAITLFRQATGATSLPNCFPPEFNGQLCAQTELQLRIAK